MPGAAEFATMWDFTGGRWKPRRDGFADRLYGGLGGSSDAGRGIADRLRPLLAEMSAEEGYPVPVLFTAHSVPCRTVQTPSASEGEKRCGRSGRDRMRKTQSGRGGGGEAD